MRVDTKSIFKSKTNWGIFIAAIPTILRLAGVPIPPGIDEEIIVLFGSVVGIFGRFKATQRLTVK